MRHQGSRRSRQYAAIPNDAMRDQTLSIDARGMLALLMTYADDWVFHRDHLMTIAKVGRDRFQKIMRELIEAGYVRRIATRGQGGKVAGSTWLINDAPETNAPVSSNVAPTTDQDRQTDRQPEFPALGSTDSLKNRPPEKPTAGFSGPLRRPTDKKTKRKEKTRTRELDFERFWQAHPRPRNRERTHELFEAEKNKGISAERLIQAADRYRAKNRTQSRQYLVHSDIWLEQQRWRGSDTQSGSLSEKPSNASPAEFWAEKVITGAYVPQSAISAGLAREMIDRGLVTASDLRRAGLA
ncbi:hypothetical protein [Pseudooceanicola lipolyticus]|nr:hypothetical protein [Pseudooceanicola lipolyticus]